MTETTPLTPLMRQLLTAMPRDAARRIMRICLLLLGPMIPIVLLAQATQGQLRINTTLWLVGVCALLVLFLSGCIFAERAIYRRNGLRDNTVIRYVGPLSARWANNTRLYLQINDAKIRIEPLPLRERPMVRALKHGTALYSPSGDIVFALWDAQGRCVHQYPGFDLDQADRYNDCQRGLASD